jgi:hypothetical protein
MMIGRSRCFACLDRGIHDRLALLAQLHGKGNPQDRVFGSKPDEHQEADLKVDVVFKAPQPVRQGAQNPEGHGHHHGTRQGP